MKIQSTVSTHLNREKARSVSTSSWIVKVASVYVLFYYTQSNALTWTLTPFLQGQETYSDNINLAQSGQEKSAFVTAVNPGVSIYGQSPRSTLNFNYRMQNLYNAGGDGNLTTHNQLQSNSQNIFIQNKLFLTTNSSISQQNINNNRIGADNINGSANRTNVYNFGLSPYWTPRFANYANGNVRVNINSIATSGGNDGNSQSSNPTNTLSDSVNLSETIGLSSGAYFQRVNWNLGFNNSENHRIDSPNVSFQNSNARVSTSINQKFSVFAQGGYSNNNYQTTNQTTNQSSSNNFYYTFGGQWRPSQRYSVTVGAGNNSYITVYVSPIQRLQWTVTYSNNAVGTNFGQYSGGDGGGNSGSNWTTALNYTTRRSTWSITHNNTTTTTQQILSQNQILSNQNSFNNTDQNAYLLTNPNLNDEVIVTKRWNLSASFFTGKSSFSANAYEQTYGYQNSGDSQKMIGVSGTWNWRFASKTSAYFTPQWQKTDSQGLSNNSNYYTLAIGVNSAITSRLSGILDFRHISQTSGQNTGEFIQENGFSNGYQENRATATLTMRF